MRRRQFQSHTVDFLFTLSLFCVFAVCAFLVVSMGVKVYRSTARYLEDTYSARTALSYVAEKIRQHDAEGQTALTQLEGRNAILLTDEIDGSRFCRQRALPSRTWERASYGLPFRTAGDRSFPFSCI